MHAAVVEHARRILELELAAVLPAEDLIRTKLAAAVHVADPGPLVRERLVGEEVVHVELAQLVDRVPEQCLGSRVRLEQAPVRVADERGVRRLRVQLTVVLLAARKPFDDLGVSHGDGRARREQADRLDGRMVEGVRVGTAQPEDAAGLAVVVDRREHDRAGAGRQAALRPPVLRSRAGRSRRRGAGTRLRASRRSAGVLWSSAASAPEATRKYASSPSTVESDAPSAPGSSSSRSTIPCMTASTSPESEATSSWRSTISASERSLTR